MPDTGHYCIAAVGQDGEPKTSLASFDDVLAYLRATYNTLADEYADARVDAEEPESDPVGGFGIWLRNRWGSEVEVGVGREAWFLFRLEPKPSICFSDNPPLDGYLVFYLDGGHYTDLASHDLASRAAAVETLRRWLETNEFPPRRRPPGRL
jgi:hypothetical protein